MAKVILIIIVAVIIESVGVAFLSGGMKEIKGAAQINASEIARVARAGATNGKILAGIALEAVFFGVLLYLLSTRDVSFVWPLTSLGFIFTTLAAQFILSEKVTASRWAGVALIVIGATLVSYSEAEKGGDATAAPAAGLAPLRPE